MNSNQSSSFSTVGFAQLAPVSAGCATEPSQRAWQWVHEQLPSEPDSQHLLPAVGALALYHLWRSARAAVAGAFDDAAADAVVIFRAFSLSRPSLPAGMACGR
jgi:hypothetical protein